jgi:hypothetical protein
MTENEISRQVVEAAIEDILVLEPEACRAFAHLFNAKAPRRKGARKDPCEFSWIPCASAPLRPCVHSEEHP